MGIDDLLDDHEQEKDEERVDELAEELGVESKEDLEHLDGRISRTFEQLILLDAKVERLEDEVSQVKKLLAELINYQDMDIEDDGSTDDGQTTTESWLERE